MWFKQIKGDGVIREVLAVPRPIPRRAREAVAEILYDDIIEGKSPDDIMQKGPMGTYGAFFMLYLAASRTEEWERMRALARKNEVVAVLILKATLVAFLDMLESLYDDRDMEDEGLGGVVDETVKLWNRNISSPSSAGAGSQDERVESLIESYLEKDGTGRELSSYMDDRLIKPLDALAGEVQEHLDSIEAISCLYPGRGWDRSMLELHRVYLGDVQKYSKIAGRSMDLKQLIDMVGRIEAGQGMSRLSALGKARSEVHSIMLSGELERLLPSETVKLQDETLKGIFFSGMIEGKLLSYHLRGKGWAGGLPVKKKKGPVVALVDTSGSMHGAPETLAKAIVLAIVKKMHRERRAARIVLFGSTGEAAAFDIIPERSIARDFLDFLGHGFGGGTDFNTALRAGLTSFDVKSYKGADLLFITDGLSMVTDGDLIKEWKELKARLNARILTIIIGNDNAGGLKEISDVVHLLDRADGWSDDKSPAFILRLLST